MPRHEIAELREQRAAVWERMKEITDRAEAEGRDLSGEEVEEFDRCERDFDAFEVRYKRLEKVEGTKPTVPAVVEDRQIEPGDGEDRKAPESYREWLEERSGGLAQDDPEYRQAFYRWLQTGEQISNLPAELRAQSKATAGAGANLVPIAFERTLIGLLRYTGVMRQIATVMSTATGNQLQVPQVTGHGTAAWTAESAAFAESDETFGQTALNAYKEASLVTVSEELLNDSAFDLEQYLSNEFALRFGVLENVSYWVGDGSGKPTGIATQVSTGFTLPTGSTVGFPAANAGDGLFELYHSLLVPYRRNAVFVANDQTIKSIREIKDGQGRYMWMPGLSAGAPDTLLGRPLYSDPDVPIMGANAKSVFFGDFSYYWVRDVQGVAFQRLVELYAANGQVGFRAYKRTDGKLLNTAAVKALANSAT